MPHRDPGGHSRWHRLRPRDLSDLGLVLLALVGLVLLLAATLGLDGSETGTAVGALLLGPLLVLHASTPFFLFLAAALYLTRGGRTIGPTRGWVWGGFALTAPLWFLVGDAVTVKGLGDVTFLLVLWNFLAFAVMYGGIYRELHDRRAA